MKLRGIPERWIIITVSVLLMLALGLLARSITLNGNRSEQVGELALERSLNSQRWQMSLQMKAFIQSLNQQAVYINLDDSATGTELIHRWLPVMSSRFALKSISSTDEQGNEQRLERVDSTWRFSSTVRSSTPPVTMVQVWPVRTSIIPPAVAGPPMADPRKSTWFSQALENRQDGPVWSEGEAENGARAFQISLLVRSGTRASTYHVLHYDIDARVLLEELNAWSPDISNIILSPDGTPITATEPSKANFPWDAVLNRWKTERSTEIIHASIAGQDWTGRILPMELNGTTLYTGALVGVDTVAQWTGQGRMALWTLLLMLVLLATLLVMVFVQSRGAERRVRKHERRSNLQARHLAKALVEREVLDREVHHRVKNNLQVVSSLLNLQAQRVPGEDARSEFLRGKRRIDSMALVHHKLYRQEDLSAVDLKVFLDDLAKAISAMFEPESRTVSHSVDTNNLKCDADTSIQLGMITCELLANCFQHAFPYATGGHIHIGVREGENGSLVLTVKDNGKGYEPESVDASHLGLEIVEALADQLDGSARTEFDGGTAVEVTFNRIHHD